MRVALGRGGAGLHPAPRLQSGRFLCKWAIWGIARPPGCVHASSMTAAKVCACFLLTLVLSGCAQWLGGVDAANDHAEAEADARADVELGEANEAAERESSRHEEPVDRADADAPVAIDAPAGPPVPPPPVDQDEAAKSAYWACHEVDSAYTYSEDENHWDVNMRTAFVYSNMAADADEQWAPLRAHIAELTRTGVAEAESLAADGFDDWLTAMRAVRRDCKGFGRFPRLHNSG